MRTIRCSCGQIIVLSDANRCPYCHFDLVCHTDAYVRAHLSRCSQKLNPYVYSDNPRGRPKNKVKEKKLEERSFTEHCRNCGTPHCQGCDEGWCEDWTMKEVGRCPFCGRVPVMVEVEDTYAVICDECSVKMIDHDKNALITRWNRD